VEQLVTSDQVTQQVEIDVKYEGYIARQKQEVMRHAQHEAMVLPKNLDYDAVRGLSNEVKQKLSQHQPETIGQATRISGVTPAAISLLLVHMKRGKARHQAAKQEKIHESGKTVA
jgi:tRNA uridine 5-carboxymethylaminomethyl modification enzyme